MNKKKIWVVVVLAVAFITVVSLLALFIFNLKKEVEERTALMAEVDNIWKLFESEDIDKEKFEHITKKRITTSSRVVVEDAIEEFTKDLVYTVDDIYKLLKDEKFVQVLTTNSLKDDMNEFNKSLDYVKTTKEKYEDNKKKLEKFKSEDYVEAYIIKKTKNKDLIKIYNELVGVSTSYKKDLEDTISGIDRRIKVLDIYNEALNFLKSNNQVFKIEGEQIIFSEESKNTEYQQIIGKLKEFTN